MTPEDKPQLPRNPETQAKPAERKAGAGGLASVPAKAPPRALGGIRARGASATAAGFAARLRSLSRRDLAFILAGLAVLLMAPVAEHLLSSPDGDAAARLEEGFDRRGALFPDGTSVYEDGTGGFSPGGLVGQDNDVITPLNVRDPSALVLGAEARPRAPVGAPTPGVSATAAKPTKDDWRNALSAAATGGAKAAAKRASLPAPTAKMAGALRGLGALSGGGSGASFKLDTPALTGAPNRARDSGALSRVSTGSDYRGVANRSLAPGSGLEALKAGGNRQGDVLNRGGATNSLDTAANTQISGGNGQGGASGPSEGRDGKDPGGSSSKDNKSTSLPTTENLALLRAKLEMEKSIDLKYKKKAWKEFEREKMLEELLMKSAVENLVGKGLFEPIGKASANLLGKMMGGGAKDINCVCKDPSKGCAPGHKFTIAPDDKNPNGNTSMIIQAQQSGYICDGTAPALGGTASSTATGGSTAAGATDPAVTPTISAGRTEASNAAAAGAVGVGAFGALDEADNAAAAFTAKLSGFKTYSASDIGAVSAKLSDAKTRLANVSKENKTARESLDDADNASAEVVGKDAKKLAAEDDVYVRTKRLLDKVGTPNFSMTAEEDYRKVVQAPDGRLGRIAAADFSTFNTADQKATEAIRRAEQAKQELAGSLGAISDTSGTESIASIGASYARERRGSPLIHEAMQQLGPVTEAAGGAVEKTKTAEGKAKTGGAVQLPNADREIIGLRDPAVAVARDVKAYAEAPTDEKLNALKNKNDSLGRSVQEACRTLVSARNDVGYRGARGKPPEWDREMCPTDRIPEDTD